jgi:hypothetical protein
LPLSHISFSAVEHTVTRTARRRSLADTAFIAGLVLMSFAGVVYGALAPRATSRTLGAIYAPWTSSTDALLRATHSGARFVSFGALPFIVIGEPGDASAGARSQPEGAWFVFDPTGIGACLASATG